MLNSLWLETAYPRTELPALKEDVTCDVCIIGGGLSGLTAAYLLAKTGKHVVLLEKDRILEGASGNNTGKLTTQHDIIYAELIKKHGADAARLYYRTNDEAIRFAESIAAGDELRTSQSVLYASTADGLQQIENETAAYQEIGIHGDRKLNSELPIDILGTLTIHDQAQLHPVRFGQHLCELAMKEGAGIHEKSDVRSMDLKDKSLELASGAVVRFNELILCTHYPIEAIRGLNVLKLEVKRSYVVSAPADMPLQNQYLSTDQKKRSIRTAFIDGRPHFMLGGEGHVAGSTGDTDERYSRLAQELQTVYNLGGPAHQWSAQDPTAPHCIPYAGPISDSMPYVHICTGFRKWGMSNSLAAARIITDVITGTKNPAISLYAPDRTGFGSLLFQALKTTGYVAKEFTTGHVQRTDTPICTHMGCRTRWNKADETWDCPCHGSRFRKDGTVLEGPAVRPLDLSE
ncbi:FAD-dependent oxidoreductase [Sporosarcina koreensis]|uniref:FAD-dependent oxidoreductase n=1 Tax=Sporosarcina koreensis TaxID=334735 RepID=UPI00058BB931|nr:FAD-dependent oxidoreductase [Sporosarcina koreensis]